MLRHWSMARYSRSSLIAGLVLLLSGGLSAAPVLVRHVEGDLRGFLVLRTLDGTTLADGDLTQTARGDHVTSRVVFHFRDGSIHDETVVFSQRRQFRLVSDRLVQSGPSFRQPMEVTIDAASGRATVRYRDKKGGEQVVARQLKLPEDAANGLMLTLVKNIDPKVAETTVSMVAASPKPRLIKLAISPAGEDAFSIGGSSRKAIRYVVKTEIGGLAGLIAPLLGKKPPDTHVWVLLGETPAFVKSEGPLYFGGPVWRIELAKPVWPERSALVQR